ncbi:MAG: hypothetical protein WCJ30_26960 [Deltaproteobacteria bacterium]
MMSPRTAQIALMALLSGCGAALPSPVLVDKLRLLAVTADPAEMLADGAMTVHAMWADGSARAGRPVYFLWRVCPEIAESDPRMCLQRNRGTDLGPAQVGADTVTLRARELPAAASLGTPPTRGYILLLAMCPDEAPSFDATLGQYVCPAEQSLPNARREGIQAFRHVLVRDSAPPPPLNRVPVITRVNIAGMDPAVTPSITVGTCARNGDGTPAGCAGVPMVIYPASDAAETFAGADGGVTTESLLASFFVTAGSTDRPRAVPADGHPSGDDGALHVTWYPPATAATVRVWFALHDGRGGDAAAGPFTVTVR